MSNPVRIPASTTEPVAALAQSRGPGPGPSPGVTAPAVAVVPRHLSPGGVARFAIGPDVTRTVARVVAQGREVPLYRPLRIFTVDPTLSRRAGGVTTVNVGYEPLQPGPESRLFRLDPHDPATGRDSLPADLNSTYALLSGGYDPAPSDQRFHKQMLYAVCSNVYAAFRVALGRDLTWGFTRTVDAGRLWLRPHAFTGINACYDKQAGALCFGYAQAPDLHGAISTLPGEYVFTCLSHDIVAHEMSHAVLDGLRSHFDVPSGPDVAAFHEAFADLIAVFQRLAYRDLVRTAIVSTRGVVEQSAVLVDLARQAGYASGCHGALRSAFDSGEPLLYDETLEAHALGAVLVAAVFDAFLEVFKRKTAPYLRLASDGSGVLRPGELAPDLADLLADKISALAAHFQGMLIRAIDYCPPVDIRFGEFLRALITADNDLVPDDPWGYREALTGAFLRHAILPRGVSDLSEAALLWRPPRQRHAPLAQLDFGHLAFDGDPGRPASSAELLRQARVLGEYVAQPHLADEFGLVPPGTPGFAPGAIGLPTVMSIRSARRIGPARQIVFDLVAEVVQRCEVTPPTGPAFPVHGGCTVILGPDGMIRYIVSKSVTGLGRMARRAAFIAGPGGQRYWTVERGRYLPRSGFFSLLHAQAGP